MSEAVWTERLSGNRAGRLLSEHLSCLDLQSRGKRRDSGIQEAILNEKVFIHALARSLKRGQPLPCGLMQPLPRFIAILNLSGQRSLVYSDNPALVRCLCVHSSRMQGAELLDCLTAFEAYPMNEHSAESSRFVLLTYSLPWQVGTDAGFWHLSACEVATGATAADAPCVILRDRILHVSSVSNTLFKGKSVRDPSDQSVAVAPASHDKPAVPMVSDKQIADFLEAYSATNLDFDYSECAECTEKPEKPEKSVGTSARLNELVQVLKQERARDQMQIRQLLAAKKAVEGVMKVALEATDANMKDAKHAHVVALESHRNTAKDMLDVSRHQNDAFAVEIVQLRETTRKMSTEHQKAAREHKKLVDKNKEVQRQGEAKDVLHNAVLSNHVGTISRLEGSVAANDARLAATKNELQRTHSVAVAKLAREHEQVVTRLTEALESKKRIINQLSENNDSKDVEKRSLTTHTDEQAARINVLEVELKKLREAPPPAQPPAPPPQPTSRSKAVGTRLRNASTATHHCASTQTPKPSASLTAPLSPTPPPEPVVTTTGSGTQNVAVDNGVVQKAPSSYQGAIDLLQKLVSTLGPTHQSVTVQAMPNGYGQPLPFPHFTPVGMYAPGQNGNFHSNYHPHHPHPHHPHTHPNPHHIRQSY